MATSVVAENFDKDFCTTTVHSHLKCSMCDDANVLKIMLYSSVRSMVSFVGGTGPGGFLLLLRSSTPLFLLNVARGGFGFGFGFELDFFFSVPSFGPFLWSFPSIPSFDPFLPPPSPAQFRDLGGGGGGGGG
jgi:hypothetical protein